MGEKYTAKRPISVRTYFFEKFTDENYSSEPISTEIPTSGITILG